MRGSRASLEDANNLPQSLYDISQVTIELVPEELQVQEYNESWVMVLQSSIFLD